jgi:hypothetical protein
LGPVAALRFALPVIIAGAVHIAVIRLGLFPRLGRIPIDGGLRVRGRRLFGANKTLRGLLVLPAVAGLAALLLSAASAPANPGRSFLWGAGLGVGYMLGELPNSSVKRQLDIAPGAAAAGVLGPVFWVIDQIDSLVGVLLVARLFGPVPGALVGWLLLLTLLLHPLFAWVMVGLGLKRRVG